MEPSFIGRKYKFWVKKVVMYFPQKTDVKIRSSLVIVFFSTWNSVILHGRRCKYSVHYISCLRKTHFNAPFSSIRVFFRTVEHQRDGHWFLYNVLCFCLTSSLLGSKTLFNFLQTLQISHSYAFYHQNRMKVWQPWKSSMSMSYT
jgi:hypothetical protein